MIRPIVLCGPSLRNFDVTDLMHKALFNALKRAFGDKLEVVHIEEKWLKPFHNALANKTMVGTTGEREMSLLGKWNTRDCYPPIIIDFDQSKL